VLKVAEVVVKVLSKVAEVVVEVGLKVV